MRRGTTIILPESVSKKLQDIKPKKLEIGKTKEVQKPTLRLMKALRTKSLMMKLVRSKELLLKAVKELSKQHRERIRRF